MLRSGREPAASGGLESDLQWRRAALGWLMGMAPRNGGVPDEGSRPVAGGPVAIAEYPRQLPGAVPVPPDHGEVSHALALSAGELAETVRALRDGPETTVEVSGIAANALGARKIGTICYDLAQKFTVQSLLVADDAIATAQKSIWRDMRILVEPAGAAALAALQSGAYTPEPDERVAILLCGANPAPDPFE